jgi:hypothetical protein
MEVIWLLGKLPPILLFSFSEEPLCHIRPCLAAFFADSVPAPAKKSLR